MDKIQVAQIGQFARNQFKLCPQGKVLAVFSSIIYLINENDEIFWLSSQQFPMHRRSIQLLGQIPKVRIESKYYVKGQSIEIDPSVQLDLSKANIWESPQHLYSERLTMPFIQDQIQTAYQIFLSIPEAKGLGVFLPKIISKSPGSYLDESKDTDELLGPLYWSKLNNIISACKKSDYNQIQDEAIEIVGLGEGLTPSGDDFYGGLYFCLNYYNNYISKNFASVGVINLDQLREMTNQISFAITSDMAQGYGVDTLHQLLENIFLGVGNEKVYENCTKLLSIGNSTGWDILTGVVVGLLTIEINIAKHPRAIEFAEIPN